MDREDREERGSVPERDRESAEERARAIAEHAAALILELDQEGRTLFVGAGCTDILGYTPEELRQIPLRDLVHPEDRERVVADYCQMGPSCTALTEHRGRHKDGSWIWLQDTVRAYQTRSGERRYAVIGRDVTAQKKLEAALERQAVVQHEIAELSRHFLALEPDRIDEDVRAHLELAARLAGAGRTHLVILEPDGSGIHGAYGWSVPEAPAEGPRYDPEALERYRWSIRTLLAGQTINAPSPDSLPPEGRTEAEDMRRRGVAGLLAIPIWVAGRLIGHQVFETFEPRPAWSPQELTELRLVGEIFASAILRKSSAEEMERRRRYEAQVAALSRRFLGLSVDEIDDAVEAALAESAALADARCASFSCASPEPEPGRTFFRWCMAGTPAPTPELLPWVRTRLSEGEALHVRHLDELPPEAGAERRSLEARGVGALLGIPVLSGSEAVGFLCLEYGGPRAGWSEPQVTVLRMTGEILATALRRRRAEQALRESRAQLLQAQKLEAVGRLAGGIAHDFNNLLTVILGFSRPLLEQLPPGPVRDDVREIQAASERAAALTRQLLTFSRRQQAATQRIDVNATVAKLEGLLRPLLGEDVELLCELAPDAGWIEIDPHQLEQVVMNLAVNARDAMPHGGTLRLATRVERVEAAEAERLGLAMDGPHVVLTASDTGCGMDEETRTHLFDPFFTTKEQGKGTGLGLSIVYGVVEQAGGAISVSGALAKGTTFEIHLPRVSRGATAVDLRPQGVRCAAAAHVLIVDDEPSVRRVARRLLERAGHRVSEASDGEEALAFCTAGADPPDLVLTDCVMPGVGGQLLARRLRGLRPEIRVVFMSGYPLERAWRADASDPPTFLQKPFAAGELVAHVAEVLEAG